MAAFVLPEVLRTEIVRHAQAETPRESVGYLAGPAGLTATSYLPLANELQSPREFRTSPQSALAAHKLMRAERLELLAIVHSHPASPPVPSAADLAGNPYGDRLPWVIVSLAPPLVRAWLLTEPPTELDLVTPSLA